MKVTALRAGILGASLLLTACGNNATTAPSNDSKADTGSDAAPMGTTLRIATESSFKPFSYLDNQGNVIGFEIDLANALCQEMKVTCEISSQDWDGLIPGLNANRFDAIMAGMSITPERLEAVDFSDPYFNNSLVFVAKKGENVTINDVDGKSVATQLATVSADYLTKNHPNAEVKTYDKQDNAYLDPIAGRADYMLSDIVPMLDWLKTDAAKDFEVKGEPIDIGDVIGIATRKNDPLTAQLNAALATLKQNGEYDKILAKYFDANVLGSAAADAPMPEPMADATMPESTTDAEASASK